MPDAAEHDIYKLRAAFGDWLRIRLQHEERLLERYGPTLSAEVSPGQKINMLFSQLAIDAEHSALLMRLLEGKEPLPEPPPLKNAYPDYPD
jgi:hypothetical protein